MRTIIKIPVCLLCGIFLVFEASTSLFAQEKQKKDWGKLSGSLDTHSVFYKKEESNPDTEKPGINTYINLNYTLKNFSAGVQYEIFENPVLGYAKQLKGHRLTNFFANYTTSNLGVTLGNFYEQFGSGLIFRSFEERSLGINTSLRGIHLKYAPTDWISLKVLAGKPRRYLEYADAITYGADGDFIISKLWNKEDSYNFSLGGSWVLRNNRKEFKNAVEPTNVNLFGIRTGFNTDHMNINIEYTAKGKSQTFVETVGEYVSQSGDALLLNLDYTLPGFGISGVFRRIEHMDYRIDNLPKLVYVPMNYIPALTKQHKYTLPSLYPHEAHAEGEIGGQVDLFWELSPEWIGKYPLKLTLNGSWYRSLGENLKKTMPFFGEDGENLFKEVSLEAGKRINRNLKANFGFYFQEKTEFGFGAMKSYIELADVLFKLNKKISLRTEIQHMNTDFQDKAWIYGLFEIGLFRNWMIFMSDMYNYEAKDKEHFYNVGASFTHQGFRMSAAYGKNREGLQCTGGVCRYVPGYTGATVTLSYVF